MPVGIVQFYLPEKGYGYIRQRDTREEFHFTKKGLLSAIQNKDQVSFEIGSSKQGLFAFNIKTLPGTPPTSANHPSAK